jgi:anti-sigma factor RsiW
MGLLLGAHLDGQLDPIKTLEVEDHLASCETCRERLALDRALRGSLKRAVNTQVPADMRARILHAMAGEARRQSRPDVGSESAHEASLDASAASTSVTPATERDLAASPTKPLMLRRWRTLLPVASAAALVVAWGAAARQPLLSGMPDTMVPAGLSDDLLRDFVAQHSRPVPPEQEDPKEVRQFERYVGVPIHVRQQIPQNGGVSARFVGARLVPVHGGERAMMLQYVMQQTNGGVQRVSLFVYDPRRVQIGGANLAPRAIGTSEVRVGETDGYSVAITQRGGVGYTMASDLDQESSAHFVAAVDRE